MWDIFFYAVNAIMPLILLIGLGYFLKTIGMFDGDFFKKANKLVFRVCLPVLLFINVYHIENLQSLRMDVVGYCLIIVVLLFGLGLWSVHALIKDPRQKGVILQCVFRSNFAIIGIPLAEALGGSEAMAIAALISAFSIPTFNVLAVIALSAFVGDGGKTDWKGIFKKICQNPLILGVLAGILVLVVRSLLPVNEDQQPVFSIRNQLPFLYSALQNISKIASPLALIVLGGQFTFQAVKGMKREILMGTIWRLVLAPVIGLVPAMIMGKAGLVAFGINEFPALIALFGTPVAVSSAIMAGEMDNDETLAGQLVVWTSLGSILTLFVQIVILRILF